MEKAERQSHWESVYSTKHEQQVSWYQADPQPSLDLIELAGGTRQSPIIDVGGGASQLVDALLDGGYLDVSVLDLSETALETARRRLGSRAAKVTWIAADVTRWVPERSYSIWHDRAAFHFLTTSAEQAAYVSALTTALRSGGHAIIGTFAPDGPEKCSGLAVTRHDAESLKAVLGERFQLVHTRRHDHITPARALQRFQFSVFRFA